MTKKETSVTVVYAQTGAQHLVSVEYVAGMTALDAVDESGLLALAEVSRVGLMLGLYGQQIALDSKIKSGDRIEICRPLQQDPRTLRKELQRDGLTVGRGRNPSQS